MNAKEAEKLEIETGCKSMEFDGCDGLYVFFEPYYCKHIVIAGAQGKTKVNREQVLTLARELQNIADVYMQEPV